MKLRRSSAVGRWRSCSAGCIAAGDGAGPERAVLPVPGLPHRPLCAERHPVRRRRRRLPQAGQRARRRHQRRQDHLRGMRDRLRHRPRRRVLRAPEGQGPDRRGAVRAAVHRHHLRADREGAGRQDPADHAWATAAPTAATARSFTWNFPLLGTYWTAADVADPAHRQGDGRLRQAQGQEDRLVYHDSPYGKEPIPVLEALRQEARLRASC